MKYLKEYNSFEQCDRCGEVVDILSQSMYNDENICLDCKHLENTGEITGDDLRDLDDVHVSFGGNSIFPTTTPSQMISLIYNNMKHIKLFENFNNPNINLSIELENKVRTLDQDSDFTVDDFFSEYGIKGTDFGWDAILNGAEKYRNMSDEEFQVLYTEYKNGVIDDTEVETEIDEYELLWEKFTNFLDEENIDIYESYDDIHNKFMETISNGESIDEQSSDIAFYISKQCGIDDDAYIKIIDFLNATI